MKKRSPTQLSGLAFLVVFLIGVFSIALITLFGPVSDDPATNRAVADLIEFVSSATCPAALIVGAIAYFWAKGRE